MNLKQTFYTYTQNIAQSYGFDSIFDEENDFVCSIVKRNENGEIIGNYFRYILNYQEKMEKGVVVFLQGEKELDRISFTLEKADELPLIFIAIDHYIQKVKREEEEDLFLGK